MGITFQHADLILREHLHKPLPEAIYLLGRQTIHFNYETALKLFEKHKIKPCSVSIKIDRDTISARPEMQFITDDTFFGMLGVSTVHSIDHSNFEGADIIIDLNEDLPAKYSGIADFIFGGSVCDNVFAPSTYLRNLAKLLKVGGRLIDQNITCFRTHPYAVLTPAWYFDYFCLNRFVDCKVYNFEIFDVWNMYGLVIHGDEKIVPDFPVTDSRITTGITYIAEKGGDSTWDAIPSQDQYRSNAEWNIYRKNLEIINGNKRKYATFGNVAATTPNIMIPKSVNCYQFLGQFNYFMPDDYDPNAPITTHERTLPIRVIEATYGGNLINSMAKLPQGNIPLCYGNVSEVVSRIINSNYSPEAGVTFQIDVNLLCDPAPGFQKDFLLHYQCTSENDKVYTVYVKEEAHEKQVIIKPHTQGI